MHLAFLDANDEDVVVPLVAQPVDQTEIFKWSSADIEGGSVDPEMLRAGESITLMEFGELVELGLYFL